MSWSQQREDMLRQVWIAHTAHPFDFWRADAMFGDAVDKVSEMTDCDCDEAEPDDFAVHFPDLGEVTNALALAELIETRLDAEEPDLLIIRESIALLVQGLNRSLP